MKTKGYLLAVLTLLLNGIHFSGTGQILTAWGKIRRVENFPSKHIGIRSVDLHLPEDYDKDSVRRYPVLYMHDGQMLFDSSQTWNHQEWKMDENLQAFYQKTGKSCILVAIHNAGSGRYAEYFPQKPFQALPDDAKNKVLALARENPNRQMPGNTPHSDAYLRFLTSELKPYIDSAFRTKIDAANTWISGSSMGGLISWYALAEYPQIFGAAACLSTHWPGVFDNKDNPVPGAFLQYLKKNLPKNKQQRILLITGTEGLDSLYANHHQNAVQVLKECMPGKNQWKAVVKKGAGHSEKDWQQQMPEVLEFLFENR